MENNMVITVEVNKETALEELKKAAEELRNFEAVDENDYDLVMILEDKVNNAAVEAKKLGATEEEINIAVNGEEEITVKEMSMEERWFEGEETKEVALGTLAELGDQLRKNNEADAEDDYYNEYGLELQNSIAIMTEKAVALGATEEEIKIAINGKEEKTMKIYTDGSAIKGNPGFGGFAFAYEDGSVKKGVPFVQGTTTNNVMELCAIGAALRSTDEGATITIVSDSKYAIGVSSGEMKATANENIVKAIRDLVAKRTVKFEWVKGHAGHPMNELCDKLAKAAAEEAMKAMTKKEEEITVEATKEIVNEVKEEEKEMKNNNNLAELYAAKKAAEKAAEKADNAFKSAIAKTANATANKLAAVTDRRTALKLGWTYAWALAKGTVATKTTVIADGSEIAMTWVDEFVNKETPAPTAPEAPVPEETVKETEEAPAEAPEEAPAEETPAPEAATEEAAPEETSAEGAAPEVVVTIEYRDFTGKGITKSEVTNGVMALAKAKGATKVQMAEGGVPVYKVESADKTMPQEIVDALRNRDHDFILVAVNGIPVQGQKKGVLYFAAK